MFYRQNHIYMLEFKLGQKKNLKKSRKGVEKAAHFLLSQEKGTMALIHLEVKLENSRTMALTVELCFPLRLVCRWQFRAETAPWNMIPNSGQGCKATKDHLPPARPHHTHTFKYSIAFFISNSWKGIIWVYWLPWDLQSILPETL